MLVSGWLKAAADQLLCMRQHENLIQRAIELGIETSDVSSLVGGPTSILKYGNQIEVIHKGIPSCWINQAGKILCDNKQLTKQVFEVLGLPYPKSIAFQKAEEIKESGFIESGKVYVCKPIDQSEGLGVEMNITDELLVERYIEMYKSKFRLFMLEEYIEGTDLRIQVIKGKIIAACTREPAFVIGNGIATLEKLIEHRRDVMKLQNPDNHLEVDNATLKLLEEQQLRLSDIPESGRKISLKYISNMATGGIASDVTDEIDPVFQEWVTKLAGVLQTGYFGLDIISTDFRNNAHLNSKVLEINASADWLHHTFSEKRTHDVAGIILRELFNLKHLEAR